MTPLRIKMLDSLLRSFLKPKLETFGFIYEPKTRSFHRCSGEFIQLRKH